MRTTLDIDDDLLHAAKALARREKKSVGKVVSGLMRMALTDTPRMTLEATSLEHGHEDIFYGFRPIPSGGATLTNEDIDQMRDELEI